MSSHPIHPLTHLRVFANPLVVLFFRMRLRRERTSFASLSQAVPSPSPLPPPLNLPGAPGSEVSRRPHRFGREQREGGEGACLCALRERKDPPFPGWVWCSYESRRQAMMTMISTRSVASVGRSVARLRALLRSSGGICIKSLSGISSYPEGPFRSSASALLCALRSPVREAAAA